MGPGLFRLYGSYGPAEQEKASGWKCYRGYKEKNQKDHLMILLFATFLRFAVFANRLSLNVKK
jgi:hypothetical protein